MKPGEYWLNEDAGPIEMNVGRRTITVLVRHTGDRPIQIGSHFHFFEVNRAIEFTREDAYGMRLNIPAGTAVRIEPGEEKELDLVEIGGDRRMFGHNGLVEGTLDHAGVHREAMERLKTW